MVCLLMWLMQQLMSVCFYVVEKAVVVKSRVLADHCGFFHGARSADSKRGS